MARATIECTTSAMAKLLRANMTTFETARFAVPDIETICKNWSELLVDVAKSTPRTSKKLFADAVIMAFKTPKDEAAMFGDLHVSVYAYRDC